MYVVSYDMYLAVLEDVFLGDEAHVVRRASEGSIFTVRAAHSAGSSSTAAVA